MAATVDSEAGGMIMLKNLAKKSVISPFSWGRHMSDL